MSTYRWLLAYAKAARASDKFSGRADHAQLISAGLFGEAGSVLAEVKKRQREEDVYPDYLGALGEELGDCLWYFVRLADECDPALLRVLARQHVRASRRPALSSALHLGVAVGRVIAAVESNDRAALKGALYDTWRALERVAAGTRMTLQQAADANLFKTQSRWPLESARPGWPRPSDYYPLFDTDMPREERFPRELEIEFIERGKGRKQVILRCNGINVGARINDNISDLDFYRYHDIFHLSYAVFLGWSPVIRSLLRCKRKSDQNLDENEDGARAGIIEEAISAVAFSRAKHKRFFQDASQIDYDLLKNIGEFVRGYEVDAVPTWQWERAILEGFRIFRLLKANRGGHVALSLTDRSLKYRMPRRKRPTTVRNR
jgi:NTP pyrophosphatase (non-canonical NTP hydrolase)